MSKYKGNILIIDDDEDVLYTAKLILKKRFTGVSISTRPDQGLKLFQNTHFDVVLLDMNFKSGATTGNEGIFWLNKFIEADPDAYVVLNTAYGDISVAVQGMKEGAVDFITKPWEQEKLLTTISNIYELKRSKKRAVKLAEHNHFLENEIENLTGDFVTASPQIGSILNTIKKVAPTDASIMILGENGVGKEVIARHIHSLSSRSHQPFIKVDLGSLTPSLFESEMFGHVKGAFTDAKVDRIGRFELADGGTLFLDEVGNITPDLQAKLLTALQNKKIVRVGDSKEISIDARIISATNKTLSKMVSEETFRQDLMYRLNTVELLIPPLRERPEDIKKLTTNFVDQFSIKYGKETLALSEKAMPALLSYSWPGNIRELEHTIERGVILADTIIDINDLAIQSHQSASIISSLNVNDVEKDVIQKALTKCSGNLSKTAIELGMGRSTLYRKMKKYNLQ